MSSNIEGELFHHSKRADNTTQIKRQSAANVLQQYSLLAMNSLKDCESPAKTRLKMMRILTDLPAELPTKESYSNMRKKSSAGPSSR